MGHKTSILGVFLYIRVWLGTPGTAHEHACGYRVNGRMTMTSIKTEKQEVGCSYRHTVACLLSPIHSYTPQSLRHHSGSLQWTGTLWGQKVIWRQSRTSTVKILILQIKNAHSAVLLSRGIQLNISNKVESIVPTQLTFHCRLFPITFYGFSSIQRWS